jgi:hypothetical protein
MALGMRIKNLFSPGRLLRSNRKDRYIHCLVGKETKTLVRLKFHLDHLHVLP